MDGGMFGIDSVKDYFESKVRDVKGRAADYAADEITREGTKLAGRLGSTFGAKAGKMSADLANEILAPRAKAKLRQLVGAGALDSVRLVLGTYRRWLAHGKRWDRERAQRKAGQKTKPLTRDELVYHLALVGVQRDWDGEKWSKTALQKGLNLRLRQLFSGRTRKNDLLQLIDILDDWRKKSTKHAGKTSLADTVERMEPTIRGKDYLDEYMPRPALRDISRGTIDAPVRKKRRPSAYNRFMSSELREQREQHPDWEQKQVFRAAVGAWKAGKRDHDDSFLAEAENDMGNITPTRRNQPKRRPKKKATSTIRYPTLAES